MKLNDNNYLLWAKSFRVLVGVQRKTSHLFEGPLNKKDPTYPNWIAIEC